MDPNGGTNKATYGDPFWGTERRDLLFLLILSLTLRVILFKWTYLIAVDGTGFYLKPAQEFAMGQWMDGLGSGYHPLYPILVASFWRVLGNYELSGQMVSIVLGTLTIIPIYYLTRGLFGGWTAFISSVFLAILPRHVSLSADFLSDPTYTFFFVSAVWLGWEGLRGNDLKVIFLAGLATGLTYLTRPEGIGILLVLGPWFLFRRMGFRTRSLRRNGHACLVLLFSFLLVAFPYIMYLRSYTGRWTISRKPVVDRVVLLIQSKLFFQQPKAPKVMERFDDFIQQLREERGTAAGGASKWLRGFVSFLRYFTTTCHPLLFLLFIIGLVRRKMRPQWGENEGFLLSVVCLYALILYVLSSLAYSSHRYFISLVALCLIWSGRGFMELYHWFRQRIASRKWGLIPFAGTKGVGLLMAITIIFILPFTLQPQRANKMGRKEAGLWIKDHTTSSPLIYSDMIRVNYYAGGRMILLGNERISYRVMVEKAKREGVDYLVVSTRSIESICPGFFRLLRPGELKEVFRTESGGWESIIVYRVQKAVGGEERYD